MYWLSSSVIVHIVRVVSNDVFAEIWQRINAQTFNLAQQMHLKTQVMYFESTIMTVRRNLKYSVHKDKRDIFKQKLQVCFFLESHI